MNRNHLIIVLIFIIIASVSCNDSTDKNSENNVLNVTIHNTETYQHDTGISGDEDGVSIIVQAKHCDLSEIVRNADTNWSAVYRYKPQSGFIGTDCVEIEISTGSDGASKPTNVEVIKINIKVVF